MNNNANELGAFLSDFRLRGRWPAELFGVSPRTVRRWKQRGRPPRHARNMMDVVREQSPPINASLHRGPLGVLIWSWKERFFGQDWKAWISPAQRAHQDAMARLAHEREQVKLEAARKRRSVALRSYWQRRRSTASS